MGRRLRKEKAVTMAKLTRRDLLKAVGLGTTGLLMPSAKVCAQEQPKGPPASRPNIIFIMADDLGFSDIGCYGSEINTPNLDQLAADGLRFTQFYNNAKCAPSRISLLTGAYPHREKSEGIQITPNIAQALQSAGYRTLMTGKNGGGLAGLPTEQGFDRFYGLNDGACNYFNPGLKRPGENEPGRKSW
jgi:arylsulfatase A-like enzyme